LRIDNSEQHYFQFIKALHKMNTIILSMNSKTKLSATKVLNMGKAPMPQTYHNYRRQQPLTKKIARRVMSFNYEFQTGLHDCACDLNM